MYDIDEALARIEALEADNQALREAIAEATEALGHRGCEPVDLRDAVGMLDRVIAGKDTASGLEHQGFAREIEAVVEVLRSSTLYATNDKLIGIRCLAR